MPREPAAHQTPALRAADLSPPSGPTLREAHGHIGALGEALTQPDLSPVKSVDQCLHAVAAAVERGRQAAERGSPPPWVLLRGARPAGWAQGRWPTLQELDRASADPGGTPCPVVIMSFDHHMAMANSAALAAAQLAPGQVVPPSGLVQADARGNATGILTEQAAYAAWHAAPEPSFAQQVGFVRAGAAHLAALGFSQAHDLHAPPWLGPALAQLDRAGELPLSVWIYPPVDRIEHEAACARTYQTPRVRLAGGKLFADGTLNSRTALMLDPYAGPLQPGCAPHGQAMHSFDQVCSAVARCDAVGLPLAVHAIGDAAVRLTLNAFERVRPRTAGGRIEHCELIHPADVGRFRALRITASLQPCHLLADVEVLLSALPHALDRVLPIRDLLASGLVPGALAEETGQGGLVFGSDVPIVRAHPQDSVIAAVARARPVEPWAAGRGDVEVVGKPPLEVGNGDHLGWSVQINPGQAIAPRDAWACFAMSAG